MTYPALLFDLDGTIADTAPDLFAAMNHVLPQYDGTPIADGMTDGLIGGGARLILKRGFELNNISLADDVLDEATEKMVDYYSQHIDEHSRVYPHLYAFLEHAHAQKTPMAVVTNKRELLATKLLSRLGMDKFFDVLIGGDTLAQAKPHPLPLREACTRLGVTTDNAIMIGDSEIDATAAQNASIKCICVSFGYRSVNLDQLAATAIIDDYRELDATIRTLL